MSLSDFLVYLGGVGAIAAISWLFEYFGWFQNAEPQKKQLIFFVACVVVAIGAQLAIAFVPPQVLESAAPYFSTVAVIFAYLFLGEQFHQTTKVS